MRAPDTEGWEHTARRAVGYASVVAMCATMAFGLRGFSPLLEYTLRHGMSIGLMLQWVTGFGAPVGYGLLMYFCSIDWVSTDGLKGLRSWRLSLVLILGLAAFGSLATLLGRSERGLFVLLYVYGIWVLNGIGVVWVVRSGLRVWDRAN